MSQCLDCKIHSLPTVQAADYERIPFAASLKLEHVPFERWMQNRGIQSVELLQARPYLLTVGKDFPSMRKCECPCVSTPYEVALFHQLGPGSGEFLVEHIIEDPDGMQQPADMIAVPDHV